MALAFAREQRALLAHRDNFVGRSVSYDTVAWDYRGEVHTIERPANGEPARRWSTECPVCGQALAYTVYSLAAVQHRRRRRWLAALVVLLAAGPVLSVIAVDPSSAVFLTIGILGAAAAFVAAFSIGFVAGGERGLAGHGSAFPGYAKHKLFLPYAGDGRWM